MSKTKIPQNDGNFDQQLLDEKIAECEQLKLGWQRCQADFENFRKRSEREQQALWDAASIDALLKVAPTIDNLRRAFNEQSTESAAWRTGIEQIYKQLEDLFRTSGLERLEVVGQTFDPNQHEALSQVPDSEIKVGHIIQEIESGYRYHGTIVKPAKVVVSLGQNK
jgi:molecular chaperone GrpE